MRQLLLLILLCWLLPPIGSYANHVPQHVSLVPCPTIIIPGTGNFRFTEKTVFAVENEEQAKEIRQFTTLLTRAAGFTPVIKTGSKKGSVCLTTDIALKPEAYHLEITPQKINVYASGMQGFYYALQSIRQLLPAAIENTQVTEAIDWTIPAISVTDQPRFGYRGLMVDVARFFTPKENLLRIIDCMSMLKLNKLHLHLMDDNGWRIEIKRYPELTNVGSRLVDRTGKPFPERRNPRQGEPTIEKGFYTQEDIREIVTYALERHIEVIPELEMPAHSNAALASYPLLACPIVDKYIGVLPGLGGNNAGVIFCAGNDRVFTFLQGVLDEIMDLFPSKYVHLGGDEAQKAQWEKCPLCQTRIKTEKLENEEDLQGYFMGRIARYVQSKGREVMGWDELTNTTIPKDAIIFGWQGKGQAAIKAARQGHRFVMTPAQTLYLIRYQGPQWFEPLTYFGNNTLKTVYDYEPVQPDWTPEIKELLMGVQASLWTEFCDKPEDVDYLLFPRLSALAEIAWTSPARKNWTGYLKAMDHFNEHIASKGVVYARSMYNIQHKVISSGERLQVELECIRPDVHICYTTDGTNPTSKSTSYTKPLQIITSRIIKAATFAGDKQMGKTLVLPIKWNKATAKSILGINAEEMKVLVNGTRGSLKNSDSEWCTWAKNDSIYFTVDLQKKENIKTFSIGCLTNFGMGLHKPRHISISVSDDNKHFTEVSELNFIQEEIFREETCVNDLEVDMKGVRTRYVRIFIKGPGTCPANHVRPGQEAKVCFDEITIE